MKTILTFILWLIVAIVFSFSLAEAEYPYTIHSGVCLLAITVVLYLNYKKSKV
jgi:hypothetical protein